MRYYGDNPVEDLRQDMENRASIHSLSEAVSKLAEVVLFLAERLEKLEEAHGGGAK